MRLTEKDLEIIRLHYPSDSEEEWTVDGIAWIIGCNRQTVVNHAIEMGLKKDSITQNRYSMEQKKAKEAAWRERNRDRKNAQSKARYQATRESVLIERKERYHNDPAYRERKKLDSKKQYQRKLNKL